MKFFEKIRQFFDNVHKRFKIESEKQYRILVVHVIYHDGTDEIVGMRDIKDGRDLRLDMNHNAHPQLRQQVVEFEYKMTYMQTWSGVFRLNRDNIKRLIVYNGEGRVNNILTSNPVIESISVPDSIANIQGPSSLYIENFGDLKEAEINLAPVQSL